MTIPNTYLRRKIVDVLGEIGPSTSATIAVKVQSEHHALLPALRALASQGLLRKSKDHIPVWRLA